MPRHSSLLSNSRPGVARDTDQAVRSRGGPYSARSHPPAQLISDGHTLRIPNCCGVKRQVVASTNDETAARFAAVLLRTEIADAADWNPRHGPVALIEKTLSQVLRTHGGPEIRREFFIDITLSDSLASYGEDQRADTRWLYLTAEPTAAAYCVIGPTLDQLERVDPWLPARFYDRLHRAAAVIMRYYDFRDAEERVGYLRECWDGEEEGVEFPDVDRAVPACMRRKPLGATAFNRLCEARQPSLVRTLLDRLDRLEAATAGLEFPELTEEQREPLFDCNPPLPCLLTVFGRQDAVEGCFDDEMQYANECPPEPGWIVPIDTRDAENVRRAFTLLERYCAVLLALTRLFAAMPGNDGKHD